MNNETLSQRRPKALVFIDLDIVIRHFIKSHAFAELEEKFDVTYVFNDPPDSDKKWIFSDIHSLGLRRILIAGVPRKRMGSWFKFYATTVLHHQLGTRNYSGRRFRFREMIGWWRLQLLTLFSLPFVYSFTRRYWLRKLGVYEPLARLIEEEKPDLLIEPTVLTGYFINELVQISKKTGIPYLVLMNSWDNPSQKAMATGQPTKLVVWGQQTRKHAIEYMQMPPEKIEMFGAAQFEVYRRLVTETDAELRALFGVPEGVPVILYAGVARHINETRHLQMLDDAIENGDIPKCHILYRPHPWRADLVDGESNFFTMGYRHVTMDPCMRSYYDEVTRQTVNRFEMADYNITAKLQTMIAGTISSLSTMIVETLLHGKPVVCFMPKKDMENKYGRSAFIAQRLAHYEDLWGRPGVLECHDDDGLADKMRELLSCCGDEAYSQSIRDGVRYFVELDGPSYGQRLVDLAERMVNEAKTGSPGETPVSSPDGAAVAEPAGQ